MKPSKEAPDGQPAAGAPSSDERGAIARAAGLLGGLTFVSRLAGLARDVVIGAFFGTSMAADAFFVAFRIPNLFRRVVAEGATSAAFVPVFTSYRIEGGDAAAARAAAAVGGAAIITLAGLVTVGVFFAGPIVALFAPGFAADPQKQQLTVALTAAIFPYLFLVGLAAWAMGALHTFRRFTAPAIGPVLLNLSIITAALTLAPRLEQPVYALVVGVLVGGCMQFLVQLPSLSRCGVTVRGCLHLGHAAVGRVGRLLLPTLVGGAVYQINILVATLFASLLPAGSVSWLWYADRVFEFPLGIIAVAVGTAALPSLSGQASARRFDEMADSVSFSLKLVWVLCIPAMVGLWVLASPIVSVLFERGQFSPADSAMTAWALRAYVVGLLGVASVRVLAPVFYAFERPRVAVAAAAVALVVNVICDLALMGPTDPAAGWWGAGLISTLSDTLRVADLDHAGLALGTGIAAMVNAVLLFVAVRRRLPALRSAPLVDAAVRHAAAAAIMCAGLYAWRAAAAQLAGPAALYVELFGAVAIGVVLYVGAALALGSTEIGRLWSMMPWRRRDPRS